ncbi:MAG: hypothetical protein KGI51_07825 [Rhodospirillales bacterium]|nr:hypothetical protein [Rhodospirillales bacterium]
METFALERTDLFCRKWTQKDADGPGFGFYRRSRPVAASILTAAWHMFGARHFNRTPPETQAGRLARQIERLGFTRTLAPAPEQAVSV